MSGKNDEGDKQDEEDKKDEEPTENNQFEQVQTPLHHTLQQIEEEDNLNNGLEETSHNNSPFIPSLEFFTLLNDFQETSSQEQVQYQDFNAKIYLENCQKYHQSDSLSSGSGGKYRDHYLTHQAGSIESSDSE